MSALFVPLFCSDKLGDAILYYFTDCIACRPWEADGTVAMALQNKSKRTSALQKMRSLLLQPPTWMTTTEYLVLSER